MGRKNKQFSKSLHQQVYERLTAMQAFGESKNDARVEGLEKDKIFSFASYRTYSRNCRYFVNWLKEMHPECTTLKSAKRHVNEWLQSRVDSGLSAWTVHTSAASMAKLFGIDRNDPNRFKPPQRNRSDIVRSRGYAARDRHFSEHNNDELIQFCRGTGCRRNVLERLEGRDYWSRERMEKELDFMKKRVYAGENLSPSEYSHMNCIRDALETFPDEADFLHHRKDKGGRYRFAPIVGPAKSQIIRRLRETGENQRVWWHVHSGCDVHGYRADYAAFVYKKYARQPDEIPYDRINRGSGHRYQGDIYICRDDEAGKKLDRRAMKMCSRALGHNRISVVAEYYLRGI